MNKGAIGCLPVMLISLVLLVILGVVVNEAEGFYFQDCVDQTQDIASCIQAIFSKEPEPAGATVATGTYSFKGNSVDVKMDIPLDGGNVTGTVTGTCDGKIKGSYDGKDNGVISGSMHGTCDPFFVKIPASATFGGTLNKDSKTVPISFQGSGGGFSKSDSMSLSY